MGPNKLKFGISIQNFKIILLTFTFHWPKQVTWPRLNSKRTGSAVLPRAWKERRTRKIMNSPMVTTVKFNFQKQSLVLKSWTPVPLAEHILNYNHHLIKELFTDTTKVSKSRERLSVSHPAWLQRSFPQVVQTLSNCLSELVF